MRDETRRRVALEQREPSDFRRTTLGPRLRGDDGSFAMLSLISARPVKGSSAMITVAVRTRFLRAALALCLLAPAVAFAADTLQPWTGGPTPALKGKTLDGDTFALADLPRTRRDRQFLGDVVRALRRRDAVAAAAARAPRAAARRGRRRQLPGERRAHRAVRRAHGHHVSRRCATTTARSAPLGTSPCSPRRSSSAPTGASRGWPRARSTGTTRA